MRSMRVLGGLALWGSMAVLVSAQTTVTEATIKVAEAEVRSGPSESFYVTNKLKQGETVQVVRAAENGWVGIAPPAGPQSFSWINLRHLQRAPNVKNPDTWMVVGSEGVRAEVLVGTRYAELQWKPTKIGTTLGRGALVTGIGLPLTQPDGTWLPIMPPAGEIRYLKQETLTMGAAKAVPNPSVVTTASGVSGPSGNAAVSPVVALPPLGGGAAPVGVPAAPAAPAAPTAPPSGGPDARHLRAQQLAAEGQFDEAIRLEEALARETMPRDHGLAMAYLNYANWLRERRAGRPTVTTPPLSGPPAIPSKPVRPVAAAVPNPAPPPRPAPESAPPPVAPEKPAPRNALPPLGAISVQSSGPGRLRRASQLIDGRRAYVLQSAQGEVVTYATEQPGVNLEPLVERNVELLGQFVVRGDVRPRYMTVTRAVPLP